MAGSTATTVPPTTPQLVFWDNHTLAVAHSRGRVQLWDVARYRKRCSEGAVVPGAFLSSSASVSFVSAEWVAHDGPITSMAARPTAGESPLLASPPPSTGTAASSRGNASGGSGSGSGGAGLGDQAVAAAATADVVVGVNAHTHLLLSRRPPAVATGGGDGVVRVWTDEGMAAGTYYGGEGGRAAGKARTHRLRSTGGTFGGDRSGHEGAVLCVCWHPGGGFLASAGQDWAIWIWNAEGEALSYIHAHQRWTRTLSFSDNGEFLVSYAAGGAFAGWAVQASGEKQVFTIRWKHPRTLIATHAEVSVLGNVWGRKRR